MDAKTQKNKVTTWLISKPKLSGFLVFVILFVVVVFMIFQRYQIIKENDKREMANILRVVYENVEQSIRNSSTAALTLALTINDKGEPENFEGIARQIILTSPDIDAVQLVPDGIITHIYPKKGNEAALNLNILESAENRDEAMRAIANRKMYFAGPLKLRQGGVGVVGRLPVFINDEFWGFSGILIRMENLVKVSGIHRIDDSKYYFQFSHRNTVTQKEEFFLPTIEDFSGRYYDVINFPDSDWKLYIISKNYDNTYFQLLPFLVFGILIAVLFGFLITILLRKPAMLQRLVLKQARKITQSQLKYKTMFDQAAMGIANVDSYTGKFIEVNDQYCRLLGYSEAEMKALNFLQITHPDDLQQDLDNMEKLRKGQIREFFMEKRYYNKSGDIIWVNLTVSPLWGADEAPSSHIAIIEDITIKKQIKEQIAKSEARFKSLFEDSPVALWEEDFSQVKKHIASNYGHLNPENAEAWFLAHPEEVQRCISMVKIIDINNECLKLHRPKTKDELLDANLDALLDEESTKSFIKQLVAVISGTTLIAIDTKIKNTIDGERDIHLRWSVMRGYESTLERVIISTEDTTAQKESERVVINSQQRIEDLVNSIDGIVWECDIDTYELIFISRKTEAILGYTPEEWAADNDFWSKHIHPEDRAAALEIFFSVAKAKRQHDFEYRMIAADQSIVWIRDSVNVNIENGKILSLRGIMIDITKTKEAENDLNATLELVTEQKKRLMNFSYIVSHNLRSHTANIQSIITLIEAADSEEERNEMIQLLRTVSGSLNETMLNLNDLVNIQANVTLAIEPLNLKHYIENAEKVLGEQIAAKSATILNNVPDDVIVNYNPAYLESVLLNLISNAIRYSHPDREPIISIDLLTENGRYILKISDNGIGIDMKRHGDKLFGMYKTFNGNADARGIGLFMTKSQIEAMNGKIAVESILDMGTTFRVSFK